jgi:MFS family permease
MALDLFAVFFGGAIALLPVFASDVLNVGPEGLGLLRTAPSAGALIAMLLTTRYRPLRHAGPVFLTCVTIFGVSMLVFGLSTSFALSLAALFVSGLADGVSVVIRSLILRVESPEAMRGRIASVNFVFIGASNELGAFESGVAASIFGTVPAVVGGCAAWILPNGSGRGRAPAGRRRRSRKRSRNRCPRRSRPRWNASRSDAWVPEADRWRRGSAAYNRGDPRVRPRPGRCSWRTAMDLYPWVVVIHVFFVIVAFGAHGVSAFAMIRVRREQDRARIGAFLDLSELSAGFFIVAGVIFIAAGLAAALMGNHFSRLWPWASIVVLVIAIGAMTPLAANPMNEIRKAVGKRVRTDRGDDPPRSPGTDAELAAAQAALRPSLVAGIGLLALLLISWLMVVKPF